MPARVRSGQRGCGFGWSGSLFTRLNTLAVEEGRSSVMSSTHASAGPLDARFKYRNHFLGEKRKKNMVTRKGSIHGFWAFKKVQTLRWTVGPFRKVPFQNTPLQIQIKSMPSPSSFHVHTWVQSSEGKIGHKLSPGLPHITRHLLISTKP